MRSDLPHIAVVLNSTQVAASVLTGLRALVGGSLGEIRAAIANRRPVLLAELFSNAYFEEGIARLRAVVALLEESDVEFALYEIGEGESFETADLDLHEITPEILENILAESERQ